MKLDLNYYLKEHKNILRDVHSNGDMMPTYFTTLPVPKEYDYTDEEKKKLFQAKKEVIKKYVNRRQDEIRIFNEKKTSEKYKKYCDDEVKEFVKKYPQYKEIILKE